MKGGIYMKKIISVTLALVLILSTLSGLTVVASAAESLDNFEYEVEYKWDETFGCDVPVGVTLNSYKGTASDITLPSSYTTSYEYWDDAKEDCVTASKTVPVSKIGNYCFYDNKTITCVRLPDSIDTIGYEAFAYCVSLKTLTASSSAATGVINIPATVKNIEDGCFSGCNSITSVVFPSTITEIPCRFLQNCISLKSVDMSANVIRNIGGSAFSGCRSLASITLPTSLVSLEDGVFYECMSLGSISFPDSVVSLGDDMFAYCNALQTVTLPKNMVYFPAGIFRGCQNLKTVTIPKGISFIDQGIFEDCTKLTTVKYKDTIAAWKNITVSDGNDVLSAAVINCTDGIYHKTHAKDKGTITPATTSAAGKIVYKCKDCGAKISTSTINKIGTVKLSATKYTYDGKVKKPTVTVKDSKGNKIAASNYTVTYKNNTRVGKATVTITFKNKYKGTITKKFDINPKGTSISSLTAVSKGFTAKWKKQSTQTTGYQIRYSIKSSMASAKTATISKTTTVSKKITKLTAAKKYYVQVRTYKTVNGTKYYSGWSSTKAVTTKR